MSRSRRVQHVRFLMKRSHPADAREWQLPLQSRHCQQEGRFRPGAAGTGFDTQCRRRRKESVVEFLKATVAHYKALGVTIKRLLTDNGGAYRFSVFAKTCQALGIKQPFARPYRPQTNGKAERLIQTCLREWAYGRTWRNSAERTDWLPAFLGYYHARRPHSALAFKPPAPRLGGNNLLKHHTERASPSTVARAFAATSRSACVDRHASKDYFRPINGS